MKIISFHLKGKMAHFRKYYSNSSLLTYMIPPVTTIKGLIAGLLGYERNSYYELFSNYNTKIAIIIDTPIKKITQNLNLRMIKSANDLNHPQKNYSQSSTEFVVPKHIRNGEISYRILFWHRDPSVFQQVADRVCTDEEYYYSDGISVALGSAQCLGWVVDGEVIEAEQVEVSTEYMNIHSVIVNELIDEIDIKSLSSIVKDENITEFNPARQLTEGSKKFVISSLSEDPILIRLKEGTEVFRINEDIHFIWI